ncbi:MAG: cytochrome c biogenesis protein CcsA [Planctomycetota bacterium]
MVGRGRRLSMLVLAPALAGLFLVGLFLAGGCGNSSEAPDSPNDAAAVEAADKFQGPDHTWPAEVVRLAESFPVQEGGRVKPLSTLAQFAMLRIHGKRTMRFVNGRRYTPTEWLLDCLFYPDQARRHEVFLIEDWEVLDALGLPRGDKRRRDRYSFEFLSAAAKRLSEKGSESQELKDRKVPLTAVQEHILVLYHNYREFDLLARYLDFARVRYRTHHPALRKMFGGQESVPFSQMLASAPELMAGIRSLMNGKDLEESPEALELSKYLYDLHQLGGGAAILAYMPPEPGEVFQEHSFQGTGRTWLSPAMLTDRILEQRRRTPQKIALLEPWERLVRLRDEPEAFTAEFRSFHDSIRTLTDARGEWQKIPMEVSFYRADYFYWGQILFVLSFLLCALQWLRPNSRLLYRATWVATLVPLGLLVTGIVIRCILRDRPPVSTLYETFLFITTVAVVVAVIIEWINRRRVAQLVAAVMGAVGLFLAMGFEGLEKQDTMPTLLAVLDTNFWLSIHVTAVTIGYAASMAAAGIGSVYLLSKLFGVRRGDREWYRHVSRMTYGTICFGLVFSTVGTILGGIWANDSWGRFWGWDPKENGAFMIVLAQIAILHGRMGGYLREFGICLVTPLLGVVVLFSWFHVNLLGVGLHAYGFSSQLKRGVYTGYGVMIALFVLGYLAWILEQQRRAAAKWEADAQKVAAQERVSTEEPEPSPEG